MKCNNIKCFKKECFTAKAKKKKKKLNDQVTFYSVEVCIIQNKQFNYLLLNSNNWQSR